MDMCFVFIEYSGICKAVLLLHGWDNLGKKKVFQVLLWKKPELEAKLSYPINLKVKM